MKQKVSIEKHKLGSINTVDLRPMPELIERSRELICLLTTNGQLSFVLEDLQPIRLLKVRKKLFLLDHYFFFIELQRALPELELTFAIIDAGNSLNLSDIAAMVRRQVEAESLTATAPKKGYAWSASHNADNLVLRQCDYAKVLGCTTSSLKKARKREQDMTHPESSAQIKALDTAELLKGVPALHDEKAVTND